MPRITKGKVFFLTVIGFLILTSSCQRLKLKPIEVESVKSVEQMPILTWGECVEMARQENPSLLAARETVKQARADRNKALGNYLPDISGSSNLSKRKVNKLKAVKSSSIGVSASEDLFTGFENTGEVMRARRALKAAEHSYNDTESTVAYNLRSAFVKLLHAQEALLVARSIEERRRVNGEIVALRYEAGREHRGSLKRAQAISERAGLGVRIAERNMGIQSAALAKELGGKFERPLRANGELELLVPEKPISEPDFSDRVENIPSVLRLKELLAAAGAQVIKDQSVFWPTATGTADYSRSSSNSLGNMDDKTWNVGLQFNVPLFTGGTNVENLIKSRSAYRQSFYSLKESRDQAFSDLVTSWNRFIDALESLEVEKKFVEASTERAEIARLQYQDGLISFEDWDIIEQELVTSRESLLNTERDAILAAATFIRSQGYSFDAYEAPIA